MSYPSEESIDPLLSSAMAEANPTPETLAEKAQRALSSTTDLFLTEVYHRHLRSRDRRMHECAAKCCDNTKDSKIQVMGCVEQCSEDTISAKKVVSNEMEQFRTRITRCCRRCRDDAKLYLGSDVFQVKMTRFREAYQECVFECADDNIKKLPVLKKKLDKLLGAPAAPSMPMPK